MKLPRSIQRNPIDSLQENSGYQHKLLYQNKTGSSKLRPKFEKTETVNLPPLEHKSRRRRGHLYKSQLSTTLPSLLPSVPTPRTEEGSVSPSRFNPFDTSYEKLSYSIRLHQSVPPAPGATNHALPPKYGHKPHMKQNNHGTIRILNTTNRSVEYDIGNNGLQKSGNRQLASWPNPVHNYKEQLRKGAKLPPLVFDRDETEPLHPEVSFLKYSLGRQPSPPEQQPGQLKVSHVGLMKHKYDPYQDMPYKLHWDYDHDMW